MAKKNKTVVLEDIELKSQVIGYTYQKKSNFGRFIFIFIIFIVVIYYINDISVFFNNLIGRESASTIQKGANDTNLPISNNNNVKNEVIYYVLSDELEIKVADLTINNIKYANNSFSFDIINNGIRTINLQDKKYFLEFFNDSKTLLQRSKLDIGIISPNNKVSYEFTTSNDFTYFTIEEKSINDYPLVSLNNDANGNANLVCTKSNETITYTFSNSELVSIKHVINDNNINDNDYNNRYILYQNRVNSYQRINGITATFNSNTNGYIATINVDLANTDLSTVSEKYYYAYKELAKVVNFEMQTYGFICK